MATTKKAALKTVETVETATTYVAGLPDDVRADSERLDALMQAATGEAGVVWAGGIVGYGRRVLRYASGRELDWMKVAFAARKTGLSVYLHEGFEATSTQALLQQLGKHKTGKGCLIIKRLADIDESVLQELIEAQVAFAS
jgi:hypothetical protein